MANAQNKGFNAMLHKSNDMPKVQIVTDESTIKKYGGSRMFFALSFFTDLITSGIFVSTVAWASEQRTEDETPYWRTLKANGELNPKYPVRRNLYFGDVM
ncbi:MAG: hypothetical protein FWE44_04330 [Defluviitaleaceae bacterium]|nr:hypothetical protein [Defluviitaleaceae bacterium]